MKKIFALLMVLYTGLVYGQTLNMHMKNGDVIQFNWSQINFIDFLKDEDVKNENRWTLYVNNINTRNETLYQLLTSCHDDLNIKGSEIELTPMISIIDDDAIDYQIPSSFGGKTVANGGGYFSVLVPVLLSLGDKYGKTLVCGIAAEGHRIGFTTYRTPNDDYLELNENGKLLNVLTERGFEILNHSMTAQCPVKTYGVNSVNSEEANRILAEGYHCGHALDFRNTIILDKSTGKWYEVNKKKNAWVERVPTKKYALPFYMDYETNEWHLNREFDFDYSWGEWVRRANKLGLKHTDLIVHNGNTTHPFTIAAARLYAIASFSTFGTYNLPPTRAALQRLNAVTGSTNVKDNNYANTLKKAVNKCLSKKSWLVFMTHTNAEGFNNAYKEGLNYPNKDDSYNKEWICPLVRSEILTMDENDYWTNPPARLGITRWREFVPAEGTQLKVFYDILDYALAKGIPIVSPSKGWSIYGNIIQLGVDSNGQTYSYPISDNELNDEEKSYFTIGVDGSIRVHSHNTQE